MTEALLVAVAAWALAGIFLLAATHKARNFLAFRGILAEYRLLPDNLVPWVAPLLIGAELVAGLLVLMPALMSANTIPPGVAALPAGALLCLYTGAIAVNLARGRTQIDCGCGGEATPLSVWLLLRNAILLVLAGVVGAVPTGPDLATPILYAAASAPILFLWCVYAIGNQMLANAGRC